MKLATLILLATLTTLSARADYRSVMTYSSSAVLYTPAGTANLWVANSNGINAVINHPEVNNLTDVSNTVNQVVNDFQTFETNFNSMTTNWAATLDGFKMSPAASANGTNSYWWDFGMTNTLGQPLMYATLNATNTVRFLGPTNARPWSLLSFAVYANGADRKLVFPSNLPFLTTNGMTLTNGLYVLTLTNGTLFRMTLQNHEFGLEPQWTVKP